MIKHTHPVSQGGEALDLVRRISASGWNSGELNDGFEAFRDEAIRIAGRDDGIPRATIETVVFDALYAARSAIAQYADDLRYPPTGDSIERRLEMATEARALIEEATDRTVWYRPVAMRDALDRFVKLELRILADLSTAHSLRGSGASSEMRSDDREDMAEARSAFKIARDLLSSPYEASLVRPSQRMLNKRSC